MGIYETRSRRGITTYTYDLDNHLVAIAFPDGTRAAYKYDAVGHRIEKNVNGAITRYFYDGDNVLLEFDGNNQFQARYTHGPNVDQPLVMERGGSVYFFHADVVGSIRSLTDATGRPVRSWTYDSFGRLSGFDPAAQPAAPYAFAGREYDAESGLYYLRARYYDPATGGFLSSDPLGVTSRLLAGGGGLFRSPQQMNSYSYAVNNPLSFRDPTGLRPIQGPMHPVEVDVVVSSLLSRPVMNVTVVSDFQHYLSVNNYRVSYTSGYYAGIISQEGTPRVIGYVPVSDLDFMGYHEVQDTPDLSVVDMLSMATSLLLQQTQQQVQASFSVPWEKLQGQEYWDAANDPMGYLEKHGVGSSQ